MSYLPPDISQPHQGWLDPRVSSGPSDYAPSASDATFNWNAYQEYLTAEVSPTEAQPSDATLDPNAYMTEAQQAYYSPDYATQSQYGAASSAQNSLLPHDAFMAAQPLVPSAQYATYPTPYTLPQQPMGLQQFAPVLPYNLPQYPVAPPPSNFEGENTYQQQEQPRATRRRQAAAPPAATPVTSVPVQNVGAKRKRGSPTGNATGGAAPKRSKFSQKNPEIQILSFRAAPQPPSVPSSTAAPFGILPPPSSVKAVPSATSLPAPNAVPLSLSLVPPKPTHDMGLVRIDSLLFGPRNLKFSRTWGDKATFMIRLFHGPGLAALRAKEGDSFWGNELNDTRTGESVVMRIMCAAEVEAVTQTALRAQADRQAALDAASGAVAPTIAVPSPQGASQGASTASTSQAPTIPAHTQGMVTDIDFFDWTFFPAESPLPSKEGPLAFGSFALDDPDAGRDMMYSNEY